MSGDSISVVRDADVFFSQEISTPDVFENIALLGLQQHVAHLEAYGYCIVDRDDFDDASICERLLDTVLKLSHLRNGIKPDVVGGSTHENDFRSTGDSSFYALLDDEIFESALMHDVPLALITYLLGESCMLSSLTTAIRGPGTPELGLHTDMLMVPSPFPAHAQVANAFWALTDFSPEGGSTFFWPGSHKFCRRPTLAECHDRSNFVSVTARAGSLIVWHGNTWHGAGRKQTPGLRVSVPMYFCRSYFTPQEDYRKFITQEALDRNLPRFRQLLGIDHPYPLRGVNPDYRELAALNARAGSLSG